MPPRLLTFISSVLISASLFATTVTVGNLIYDIDGETLTATLTRDNSNSAITSADIPASVSVDGIDYAVTAIGDWAFYGCRSMTSVSIPASIRSIGAFAFASCTALGRVSVSDLGAWCGITFGNGYANPLMCGRNLYLDGKRVDILAIPEGVTALNESAFNGGSFTAVTFPASLTTIGNLAFYGCEDLKSVELPATVSAIGTSAFDGCTALASASLPDALTTISPYCFNGCSALESITIPASVTGIGSDAFAGCTSLAGVHISDIAAWCAITFGSPASNPFATATDLYLDGSLVTALDIPDGVTAIPSNGFYTCTSIESLTLPASLTAIGDEAFKGCSSLASINFADKAALATIGKSAFEDCAAISILVLPSSLTTLGSYAFYGCENIVSASLPDGLDVIADGLFGECTALASVNIPASAASIGFGSFYECVSLTEINIPDAVSTIGKSAFNGCTALTTLRLGSGLADIKGFAFSACTALTDIHISAPTPPAAQTSSFSSYTPVLWIPEGSDALYAAADVWKDFTDRRISGASVSDTISDETLTEYYRLDGTRVEAGNLTPGIYIRRSAGRIEKIIVR